MGSEYHNEEFDVEAQQAGRDAIMGIGLFPDLPVALRKAIGYGPHVDMLQHFIYWMHPNKPKMQKRWTLYKTYREWRDECGLTDRQVKKGRKVLRELNLVTEKKGPRGRIHYRVDWVALAQVLSLDTNTDQTDDVDARFGDEEDEFSLDAITDQGQFGRHGDQASLDAITVQPNTGEYAGDYLTEKSTLQVVGAEPAKAEPAPLLINKDEEQKEKEEQPLTTERPSQNGHTPGESGLERERGEEVASLAPPKPDDDTLLAEVKEILDSNSGRWSYACYIKNDYAPEKVADYIITNAEDIKQPEVVTSAARDELEQAVGYVLWEAAA